MQGNVIDLATAVVIGAAFGAVVNAMVENVLMPFISGLVGAPDFDSFGVVWFNGNALQFGVLLTALVNFLLIAAAIYFVIILPMNKMIEARNRKLGAVEEAPEENIMLLREIRDQLKAQTEVTNPAFIASLVEAERQAEAEAAAKAEAEQNPGMLGKAKNMVWGKD